MHMYNTREGKALRLTQVMCVMTLSPCSECGVVLGLCSHCWTGFLVRLIVFVCDHVTSLQIPSSKILKSLQRRFKSPQNIRLVLVELLQELKTKQHPYLLFYLQLGC